MRQYNQYFPRLNLVGLTKDEQRRMFINACDLERWRKRELTRRGLPGGVSGIYINLHLNDDDFQEQLRLMDNGVDAMGATSMVNDDWSNVEKQAVIDHIAAGHLSQDAYMMVNSNRMPLEEWDDVGGVDPGLVRDVDWG